MGNAPAVVERVREEGRALLHLDGAKLLNKMTETVRDLGEHLESARAYLFQEEMEGLRWQLEQLQALAGGALEEIRAARQAAEPPPQPRPGKVKIGVTLTKPQYEELRRLAYKPQRTYGRHTARVQGSLYYARLARFLLEGKEVSRGDGFGINLFDTCEITEAGRQALREHEALLAAKAAKKGRRA